MHWGSLGMWQVQWTSSDFSDKAVGQPSTSSRGQQLVEGSKAVGCQTVVPASSSEMVVFYSQTEDAHNYSQQRRLYAR
jgi:hypothetical protein